MIGVMPSTSISVANKPISNKRKKNHRTTRICQACSEEQREHIITLFLIFHLQPTKHLQYFRWNAEQDLHDLNMAKHNSNLFQNSHQYQIASYYNKEAIQTKENITSISGFCSLFHVRWHAFTCAKPMPSTNRQDLWFCSTKGKQTHAIFETEVT